jgi:tetratricopeptide (TPR) repeat protein
LLATRTAIRIGFAMWRYWQKRGHLAEARRRLQAMADAPWSRDDRVLRARLMEALGGVAWWQGDIDTMTPAYGEALAIWESIGDQREIVNALYNDSFQYAISGDPDGIGYGNMIRARDLAASIGDDQGRANVLWGLGNYRYFHDTRDQGLADFKEALGIFQRIGDRTMEAWSLHMVATAEIRGRELDAARRDVVQAMRLFHAFGDVAGITLALDDFASLAVANDDLPRAARLWGAARALSSAGGVGLADFVDQQYEYHGRPNARFVLGATEIEEHAREGRAMTLDESVAYALETSIDELAPHDHAGVR